MALYIPHSIFYLARLLYVRPETFGHYYVCTLPVSFCLLALIRSRAVFCGFGRSSLKVQSNLHLGPRYRCYKQTVLRHHSL